MVRVRDKHGIGIYFLALIPLIAFGLGVWQIYRLDYKSQLIARLSDQLTAAPLDLPPKVDIDTIPEFDHRRIIVTGHFQHEQEMLVGPRMREGEQGYIIVTPLQRPDGRKILVSRGWISKQMKEQRDRDNSRGEALPKGEIQVLGMLRAPINKNMFTPENKPGRNEWYFLDVKEMAKWVGAEEVWVEEMMGEFMLDDCALLTKTRPRNV
jgi:surfeit locus 1 family protein